MSAHLQKAHKVVDGLSLYFIGDIAIIVMERGENRINEVFLNAFNELLDEVESTDSCKGVITTGKGKFFSNGLDLKLMSTQTELQNLAIYAGFADLLKRLVFLPVPTLAAINGHAYAGGAVIASAHDLRTMNSDKGWLCYNEVFINLRFGDFTLELLAVKLGKGRILTDSIVLGKRYTAQEAMGYGFLHSMQPPGPLLQESVKVLKSFYGRGYPRDSLRAMKEDTYRKALVAYGKDVEKFERLKEESKRKEFSAKL